MRPRESGGRRVGRLLEAGSARRKTSAGSGDSRPVPWLDGRSKPCLAAAPDACRDGHRVVARLHRRDGCDRRAAADRARPRSRPHRSAVGLPLVLAGPGRSLPAGGGRWRSIRARSTFTWGVVGFALASILAGAAPNAGLLILARALQGVAGAFLTTNSLALLRATYGPRSGHAVGMWTSLTGVATIAGPPVGGALVEWTSWRWIFFSEPAACRPDGDAGACRPLPRAHQGQRRQARSGRRCNGCAGLRDAYLRGRRGGREGFRRCLVGLSHRCPGAPGVRRRRAQGCRAFVAVRALSAPELRRREYRNVPRLCGARRRPRVPRPLPAVPRFHALSGGACEPSASAS